MRRRSYSRADLFPSDMLAKGIEFANLYGFTPEQVSDYIDDYDFDSFLLSTDDRAYLWLVQRPEWIEVYRDKNLVFIVRTDMVPET